MTKKKKTTAFRGGMSELMRQASRLQRRIELRKQELKTETVEVTSANEKIKVVANGGREIVRIAIDPEILKQEEHTMVEDMIVATCNQALQKATEMVDAELEKVTGGLRIPGVV
jgi:DNA-binding YbaB/EbfC family protein